MGRDVSLMVTARDNYSSAISKMATVTKGFEDKMKSLDSQLKILNKNKAELKIDATKAKSELSAAEKQFKLTGEEADRLNAIAKQSDYNNITSNLKLVSDQAKQTEKDMRNLTDELNRQQNRAGSEGGGEADILGRLGAAGATSMIGSVANSAISAYASSALGDRGALALDSVLSGAVDGASIGLAIAGPVGAIVGALGGLALGGIQAAINDYQLQEDAFKDAVQNIYSSVTAKITEGAASGSELAASRETTRAAFNVMLGSEEAASEFLGGLQDMANRTPFFYDDLVSMSKTLKSSGMSDESLLPTLTTLGDAGGAKGMSTSEIANVGARLSYMMQSDKISQMDIKSLALNNIDAFKYLSDALGVTVPKMLEMVSAGEVSGITAAEAILTGLKEYEGGMDMLSSTFEGISGTVEELWANINGVYGDSYNESRKVSLASERDWLEGSGQGMNAWQSAIGGAHAEYDNTASAVRLGVMDAFMSGDLSGLSAAMGGALTEADEGRLATLAERYASAMAEGDGFELESLLGIAEAEAETLMASTEIAKAQHDAQLEMISGIQAAEEANNLIADRALEISNQLSMGTAAVTGAIESAASRVVSSFASYNPYGGMSGISMPVRQNAWGQNRVPYDGYFTELHEGERVLTAQEARASDNGGTAPVTVTVMGNLVVREEADLERVAMYLAEQIALAQSVAI